jgi:hypothetical protein
MGDKLFVWDENTDVFELSENDLFVLAEEVLGLPPQDIAARSENCRDILKNGVKCDDFLGVRRFVLCYAWMELEKRKATSFKQAVDDAWAYVRRFCPNV